MPRGLIVPRRTWGAAVLLAALCVVAAIVVLAVGTTGRAPDGTGRRTPTVAQGTAAPTQTPTPTPTRVAVTKPDGTPAPTGVPPAPAPAPRDTRPPATAPLPRSVPVRLRIPAIGVDSVLMRLGLQRDGTLQTPPGPFPAGWFTGSPTPGQTGPAVLAGHVRYLTPGVFERLGQLRRGDLVSVLRRDGRTARFRVHRVAHYAKSAFPTRAVYGDIDRPGLRLITCGALDPQTRVFEQNVVVFADLVA